MTAVATDAPIAAFEPFAAIITAGRERIMISAGAASRFEAKLDRTDPEHARWTGAVSAGNPICMVGGLCVRAQNVAWVLANRRDIPEEQLPASTCGDPLCLRAEHLGLRARLRPYRKREPEPARAIEELAPPGLERLAAAQFGMPVTEASKREIRPTRPARGDFHPIGSKGNDSTRRGAGEHPRPAAAPASIHDLPDARAVLAFLGQPEIAVITYKSGASMVFTPRGPVYGDDFGQAVVKAMQLAGSRA
jgi:hypothetical protein